MIILIIYIIVSYDQNISLIFYVNDGSHVRLRHLSCVYINAQRQVHCSTKDVYTSEMTFLALHSWLKPSWDRSCDSMEFPSQNLRKISHGVLELWSDIQTNYQRLLLYIYTYIYIRLSFIKKSDTLDDAQTMHFLLLTFPAKHSHLVRIEVT